MTKSHMARRWIFVVLFFLFMLSVTVAADFRLIPTQMRGIPYFDKLGHFTLYGILAFLVQLALEPRALRVGRVRIPLALLFVFALAILDEMQQSFSPYRAVDLSDLIADFLGILIGVSVATLLARMRRARHTTNP